MKFEIGGKIVNSRWPLIFRNFSGLEPFEKGRDFSGSMEGNNIWHVFSSLFSVNSTVISRSRVSRTRELFS